MLHNNNVHEENRLPEQIGNTECEPAGLAWETYKAATMHNAHAIASDVDIDRIDHSPTRV